MSGDLIEERDIPGLLGTRDGMRLAYGILWMTWSDKDTAASIARHVLLAALEDQDRAKGIEWARKILRLDCDDGDPTNV